MKAVVLLCGILACASSLPAPATPARKPFDDLFEDIFGTVTDRSTESSSEFESEPELPTSSFFNQFYPFRLPSVFFPTFNFPDFGSIIRDMVMTPIDSSDNKLVNTTSETKVIDGRRMVVNNTYWQNPSGVLVHSIVVSYGGSDETVESDETTPSAEEALPNGKKTEDNEVREEISDHASDTGDKLNA